MNLDTRMKKYEYVTRTYLTCRMPVIVRLDGKAFHTFTRGLKKPFDPVFNSAMDDTMLHLAQNSQNCMLAYRQSDEISLLLVDYATFETAAWFDNNISKIVSITASMATARDRDGSEILQCFTTLYRQPCPFRQSCLQHSP